MFERDLQELTTLFQGNLVHDLKLCETKAKSVWSILKCLQSLVTGSFPACDIREILYDAADGIGLRNLDIETIADKKASKYDITLMATEIYRCLVQSLVNHASCDFDHGKLDFRISLCVKQVDGLKRLCDPREIDPPDPRDREGDDFHESVCFQWKIFCLACSDGGETLDLALMSNQIQYWKLNSLWSSAQGLEFCNLNLNVLAALTPNLYCRFPMEMEELVWQCFTGIVNVAEYVQVCGDSVNLSVEGLNQILLGPSADGDKVSDSDQDSTQQKTVFNVECDLPTAFKKLQEQMAIATQNRVRGAWQRLQRPSLTRTLWILFCRVCTLCVPEVLLHHVNLRGKAARDAWREKIGLCILIAIISGLMLLLVVGFTAILCPMQKILSMEEIAELAVQRPYIIIHGIVVDATPLLSSHVDNGAKPNHISQWSGKDASKLFPLPSVHKLTNKLSGSANRLRLFRRSTLRSSKDPSQPHKSSFTPDLSNLKTFAHGLNEYLVLMTLPNRFFVAISPQTLYDGYTKSNAMISIHGNVYDISRIIGKWPGLTSKAINAISAPWGRDKSEFFHYEGWQDDINHLGDCFVGVLDLRSSPRCQLSRFVLLGCTSIFAMILLFKFLTSLQLGAKRKPELMDKFVIIQVP